MMWTTTTTTTWKTAKLSKPKKKQEGHIHISTLFEFVLKKKDYNIYKLQRGCQQGKDFIGLFILSWSLGQQHQQTNS